MLQKPKGTFDILPDELYKRNFIYNLIRETLSSFNFKEILTPVFESTELFKRGIGEETDIVSKEMYSFNEDKFTLRPELTAPVIRAYLENSLYNESPVKKLFYISNLFRAERPQKGRYREFWQFGAEIIGSDDILSDAEIILIPDLILKKLGINDFVVKINNIGNTEERTEYVSDLKTYLLKFENELSETSKIRLYKNPLRILDTKIEKEKDILVNAPLIKNYLKAETKEKFEKLLNILQKLNVNFEQDDKLVRGLDYYSQTTFEFQSTKLGSQNAILGGGRYDKLIELLGGKPTPAIGFAMGIERLLIILEENNFTFPKQKNPDIYIITSGEAAKLYSLNITNDLRSNGIITETDLLNRSIKSQMKEADRLKSKFVLILGDNELSSGIVKLKKMDTGNETDVELNKIEKIKELITN
ncbi:MAG TPA: histidine--tRNA ligase [Ignavibacteria bacterium]|nr:histidine--tRNA ligase [Ignavibacteria bacterium]